LPGVDNIKTKIKHIHPAIVSNYFSLTSKQRLVIDVINPEAQSIARYWFGSSNEVLSIGDELDQCNVMRSIQQLFQFRCQTEYVIIVKYLKKQAIR
jgi:hypothetical protein